jgi:tetratricopeptide (TPR) repeat protein
MSTAKKFNSAMINRMNRVSREAQLNPELLQISRRLTGLSMKRPGLAFGVYGEPGIGKTHTTLALLRGVPYQSITVHATLPLESSIKRIPRPKKITLWLEKILERLTKGETLEIGLLNQALIALLAANAPIILHVEDLHEANDARLEFFKQLALAVTRVQGVGLIVTSRVQPPSNFEAIKLQALNREESDALLEAEVSAKLPPEALTWLFERATGNPLFTLEFFRLLARQGSLWNDGQRWRFRTPERETMPVTVEALIEQVLHETVSTPALENAIGAKAVLGLGAIESLWAEVAGLTLEDLSLVKQELEHRGVLSNAEFVHPLFREVVAHGLAPEQRQGFARRALEVLKDNPRVAAEFVKDAELEDAEALGWFEKAAQAAKNTGDEVQSARFKANAVEYASGEKRAALAFEVAQILRLVDLQEASRLAEIAISSTSNSMQAIELRAELLAIQGRLIEAELLIERLPNTELNNWNQIMRFRLCATARDFAGALKIWHQNPDLQFSDDPRVLRPAIQVLLSHHQLQEAQPLLLRALAQPNLSVLDRIAFEGLEVGALLTNHENERAASLLIERIPEISASGNIRATASAIHNLGVSMERLGRHREAVGYMVKASKLYAEIGDKRGFAQTLTGAAWQHWHLGEYEDAQGLLLESREVLQHSQMSDLLVECEGILSLMYLDWSPPLATDLASKHARSALEVARRIDNPYEIVCALDDYALVKVRQGRSEEALAMIEEMTTLSEIHNFSGMAVNAMYCRALALEALQHKDQALRLMIQAETTNKNRDSTYAHKIGIEVARIAGDLELARKHLAWFEGRGNINGVLILHRYFPQLITNRDSQTSRISMTTELPHLEVLGSMQIKLESQTTPVRGRKRQELLALLLEARISGRSEVSKLELVDKLYLNADEIQANAGLRDVIYQIRSSLGESTLTTTANGYALGSLKTDVETFLETGNTQLWRGVYLEGLTLETSDTVRESIYLALRTRAEGLLETDPIEVTRVGRLLCEADPYDLEALRLTVTGLRAGQNHRSLSRFYDSARMRFLEIGEVLPARWQDFLTQIGITA